MFCLQYGAVTWQHQGSVLNGSLSMLTGHLRAQLDINCNRELFRVDVESADDIRLSWALAQTCTKDIQAFCPDVGPFGGMVQGCLEGHRHAATFGADCRCLPPLIVTQSSRGVNNAVPTAAGKGCRRALEGRMMEQARDWRLDAPLRAACVRDVRDVCRFEQDHANLTATGGITECLQDFRHELDDPECAQRVHITIMRAASDVRFAPAFHGACRQDYHRFCRDVRPVRLPCSLLPLYAPTLGFVAH